MMEESLGLSTVTKAPKRDLGQKIDRAIEPFGHFHKFLILLMCFNCGIVGIHMTVPTFYAYTPEIYSCIDAGTAAQNSTCVPGCKNYRFEDTDTSIVTEWSLVCDRRYLSALSTTIYFIGVTLGSFSCGILADRWGRRKMVFACLYLQGIIGASIYFVHSFVVFIILRFIQGFFVQGLQTATFTLIQELTPSRKLTLTGLVWELCWAFGLVILGIIAYFVRDWKTLQLVLTIPTLLTLLWFWIIPESPRWSLANDQRSDVVKVTKRFAKRNRTDSVFANPNDDFEDVPLRDRHILPKAKLLDLIKNKILRKHLLVMISLWFSVVLSYFGMLMYMPNLAGGRHLNFIVGALFEVAAYVATYFAFSLGRRKSMIAIQYFGGFLCVAIGILSFVPADQAWKSYTMTVIALIGKGVTVSGTGGAFIYGAELFPTTTRGSAIGICGFFGRVGSFIAPQIILLGEVTHPVVPMAIMAVFLFIGGTATFSVPETIHKKLPNSLEDVDTAWGR